MPRLRHLIFFALLVALQPALSACSSFDFDKLDVFGINDKKKLPGERRALFPEGIPGVAQGVPPDLMKGYQPPPEEAQAVAPEPPKPAPRRVARPARVTVQPPAPQQNSQREADPPPQQSQQAAPSQSPWPDAPRTGTFSR